MRIFMKYLTNKWSGARDMVQTIRACLNQAVEHLNKLEKIFNWRHYTIFLNYDNTNSGRNMEYHGMGGETSVAIEK